MDPSTYDSYPNHIVVREVKITTKQEGFRSRSRIIVTTFRNAKETTKKDLAMLYDCRWCVELDLRSIKDTMRMGILRGKTPSMVHKEIWAHLLAYNLIRKVMMEAAIAHNKNPRELSFKLTLQMIEAFRQAGILNKNNAYAELLSAIGYKKVSNRKGRWEPRRIKRRPKAFLRLQKARHFYHREAA